MTLHIANLVIGNPIILAPMAGYTDSAFRSICLEHHCGLVLTELVTAEGVVRSHKKTLHYLETVPGERPVGAHIYGSNPDTMAGAAAAIESLKRFDLIDINSGCPVRKIMARGAGAGLLRDPEKLGKMVRAVREAVSLPVTVKTRIGLSPKSCNISEVAQSVEEAGAVALFIHARFASVRHSGPADWECLARVKSERNIPIIGNGGVEAAQDAVNMIRQTGVDGVMIGRAALGNPWIFDEIHALLAGQKYDPPNSLAKRDVMVDHLRRILALAVKEEKFRKRSQLTSEQAACCIFRAHLVKYLAGCEGLTALKRDLAKPFVLRDMIAAVEQILQTPSIQAS